MASATLAFPDNLKDLRMFFACREAPFTSTDIQEFNSIYGQLYPALKGEEKRQAERYVDILIDGLERKELADKIFGVV